MRKSLLLLAVVAGTMLVPVPPASAAVPVPGACAGWYVNDDEAARLPEQKATGLEFKGSDLVHRAVDRPVAGTFPGTYALAAGSEVPDQPSFFSVEVRNPSGAYGTLRWNTSGTFAGKWSITIGPDASNPTVTAGTFADADPVALLAGKVTKWGPFVPGSNRIVSFGVGYTLNPPGTKTVVVREIRFAGQVFTFPCVAASQSPSASIAPSVSASSSTPPVTATGGALPITGSRAWAVLGVGALLVAAGVVTRIAARRRATRFDA